MGLRWRWTLILAAAAIGLLVVVGIGVESTLRARMHAESRQWSVVQAQRVRSRLREDSDSLEAGLDELLSGEGFLEAFQDRSPTDEQRLAREDWVLLSARAPWLDEFLVLDSTGRIVASSSKSDRTGAAHEAATVLLGALPRAAVVWREHLADTPDASNWRLSVVRDVQVAAGNVRAVASRVLDGEPLQELGSDLGLAALHWGPPHSGEELLEFPADFQLVRGAHLSFAAGPPEDVEALRALRRWLVIALGLALLFALAGSPWIASGFGAPLEEMSAAMERIGQGSRRIQLEPAGPPEIRRLQTALRQLVADLDETETRVRQAERQATWRELARRIAHEIRNVLSPLALALDNLETVGSETTEVAQSSFAVARDQIESLSRLAREFSEYARQPEPSFHMIVVADLLDSVVQLARAAFGDLELRRQLDDAPDSVDGDAEQLRRAVYNLIKNAVEAAPGRPVRLACGAGPTPASWWIEVGDEGPGLPHEVEASLGELQRSTREGGSGLGLAITCQVAAAHGGELEVLRPVSGGTVMRLSLARRLQDASPQIPGGAPR